MTSIFEILLILVFLTACGPENHSSEYWLNLDQNNAQKDSLSYNLTNIHDLMNEVYATSPIAYNVFHQSILAELSRLDCASLLVQKNHADASGYNCLMSRLFIVLLIQSPIAGIDSEWILISVVPAFENIIKQASEDLAVTDVMKQIGPSADRAAIVEALLLSAARMASEALQHNDQKQEQRKILEGALIELTGLNLKKSNSWVRRFAALSAIVNKLSPAINTTASHEHLIGIDRMLDVIGRFIDDLDLAHRGKSS